MRPAAEVAGATQFEALTLAALAEFRAGEWMAVVEAGRREADATNADAPVVVLTNVDLEHTDVLGATRAEIAREKLAVIRPGATAVLGEPEWEELQREAGAAAVVVTDGATSRSQSRRRSRSSASRSIRRQRRRRRCPAGWNGGGTRRSRSGTAPTISAGSATCLRAFRPPLRRHRLDPRRVDRMLAALAALG